MLDLRARYRLSGPVGEAGLERVLEGERIRVDVWDFNEEVIELIVPRRIAISAHLNARERRWVVPHALAHHVMHRGNHLWLGEWFGWLHDRQERQAHEFAGWWHYFDLDPLEASTLAEAADQVGIPFNCLEWWSEQVLRRVS